MYRDRYDRQKVCLKGHLATNYASAHAGEFCQECGEKVISACPKCAAPLRGADRQAEAVDVFYKPPQQVAKFCESCGSAYPWTQRAMQSALALTAQVEGITTEEQKRLEGSISDLTSKTPGTESAIVWWRAIIQKAPGALGSAIIKTLGEVMIAEARRKLGLP